MTHLAAGSGEKTADGLEMGQGSTNPWQFGNTNPGDSTSATFLSDCSLASAAENVKDEK